MRSFNYVLFALISLFSLSLFADANNMHMSNLKEEKGAYLSLVTTVPDDHVIVLNADCVGDVRDLPIYVRGGYILSEMGEWQDLTFADIMTAVDQYKYIQFSVVTEAYSDEVKTFTWSFEPREY